MALMMALMVVFIAAMPGQTGLDRAHDAPAQVSQPQPDDTRSAPKAASQFEQDARNKAGP